MENDKDNFLKPSEEQEHLDQGPEEIDENDEAGETDEFAGQKVFVEPLKPSNTKKGQYQRKIMRANKGRVPELKQREVPEEVPMASPVSDVDRVDYNNRPTVKVYDKDGYSPRKRRAVSLGLSELILPPFTKGIIAKYKMISDGRIDPATKEAPDPQDAEFPGTYTLYDRFEADPLRRAKLMKNLGREELVVDAEGKEKRNHTINPIHFIAGIKSVNIEANYREYVFMELHPLNKSNRHRPNDIPAHFERIDLKNNKNEAFKEAERDLAIDAETYIQKHVVKQELIIGYATAFGIPTWDRKISDIKMDLRRAAFDNPIRFFSMSKDSSQGIKLNIHSGMSNGLIEYQTDRHCFVFTENNELFHQVGIQEDPVESITSAILKEEAKMVMYEDLVDMLNYWEQ